MALVIERRIRSRTESFLAMAAFKSLWVGSALSPIEQLCIRSFLANGHTFELFCYGDVSGVPDGCLLRDANEILRGERVFPNQEGVGAGSFSAFSDLFRYKLLHDTGGWWVDTDVVCLTAGVPVEEPLLALEDKEQLNTAIMKFPAHHPLMAQAFARADAAGERVAWGQTGPMLMAELVVAFGLQSCIAPAGAFYPIHWSEHATMLSPQYESSLQQRIRGASFLHLWNEMFRRSRYDKWVRPPQGSFLYALMARFDMLGGFEYEYALLDGNEGALRMQRRRVAKASRG